MEHISGTDGAFTQHGFGGLACFPPAGCTGVVVEWDGPPTPPVANVDYTVTTQVNPPNVILRTTEKDGILVGAWRIGRTVSSTGGARDIGTISAIWAPPSIFDIDVSVGTIPGRPVGNVSIVDIPPQSPANWSSLTLDVEQDLRIRAHCSPTEGDGGLISGTIGRHAGLIYANGIGVGAAGAGALTIGGDVQDVELAHVPVGSTMSIGRAKRPIEITGRLDGQFQIEQLENSSSLEGIYRGSLVLADGGSGSISIPGELNGGEITVAGQFDGTIEVERMVHSIVNDNPQYPSVTVGDLGGSIHVSASGQPMEGSIQVGSEQEPATLLAGGEIRIDTSVAGTARLDVFGSVSGGGRIQLSGGMAAGSQVDIHGNLEGTIEVLGASNELSGTIELGESGAPANITHTGLLTIDPQITGAETLVIHGNVDSGGRVQLKNGVADGGSIRIAGDLGGTLEIGAPVVFGGTLAGEVNVDGAVAGTISHYGLATSTGTIDLGSVTSTGKYTQTQTNPTAPWEGSLTVHDDVAGALMFKTKLQDASVVVEGSMSGAIDISEMYDSMLALNTVDFCSETTSGTITVGAKSTVWTPSGGSNNVELNAIDVYGDFTSTANLKFYVWQFSSPINTLGTVCFHGDMQGTEQVIVPRGVTPPGISHCPATTDPCDPSQ